jgi:cell wall-associated NlpC family hydrolase
MIGELVAAEAERWIDTPFKWQASVRGRGADCKGLIAGVARELGRAEADSVEALAGDYGDVVDSGRLRSGLARLFDQVKEPQAGDVLLIQCGGKPQHLAIFAPNGRSGGLRVIEAMFRGPARVRPYRRSMAEIDSIWRWRA